MSDAYHQLLDATIQHLSELKARGVRFVPVSSETMARLKAPASQTAALRPDEPQTKATQTAKLQPAEPRKLPERPAPAYAKPVTPIPALQAAFLPEPTAPTAAAPKPELSRE